MIPENFIEAWQQNVQWQTLSMIEQDLIISRALVCLYVDDFIRENLIFRGGTALNKLYIQPAARYSEDLDFVQSKPMPIGTAINAIRNALDSWLGEPKRKLTKRGVKLIYQYESISKLPSKLKIEINTTEHLRIMDLRNTSFSVHSEWFEGRCAVVTYQIEELMATKLRALYQRRKGRDLFDLWWVVSNKLVDVSKLLMIFKQYCEYDGTTMSKDLYMDNLRLKRLIETFKLI